MRCTTGRQSDVKAQRQQRSRMRRDTEKMQRKSARRRKKQHRLKSGHSTSSSAETLSFGFEVSPTTEVAEDARLKAMIEKARKKEKQDQRDILESLITAHVSGRRSRLRRCSGIGE